MTAGFPVRLLPSFAGAVLVTLAVFLFMQSLIERGQREEIRLAVYENVEIVRPEPEQDEPEAQQDAPEEMAQEPVMDALQVAAPTPQPAQTLEVPALDLALGDMKIQAVGKKWSAPLGKGAVNLGGSGQDARGFVEVVPFNTRDPNVPEVAWQNKINGWVLVAFTVTPRGNTQDIRVLDANPRGVFEESVIAAVEDWQYNVDFSGKNRAHVVLTQRVEVRWDKYHQNLPNVD
jgi:periplasmic protein TonB